MVLMRRKILKLFTPAPCSLVDINFHGNIKIDQAADRSRDRANRDLVHHFRTLGGAVKAGNPYLILKNLHGQGFRTKYSLNAILPE